MAEAALLRVANLNAWYGESHVLHGVEFPKAACLSLASFGGNVGMMSGFAGYAAPLRLPFSSAPLREPS